MAQSNDSYVWMFAKSVVVFLVFAWLSYTAPKVFDQFHLSQLVKLVGGIPTPLKNMSLSVGMIIPNIWKNQIHVPNHQPVFVNRMRLPNGSNLTMLKDLKDLFSWLSQLWVQLYWSPFGHI